MFYLSMFVIRTYTYRSVTHAPMLSETETFLPVVSQTEYFGWSAPRFAVWCGFHTECVQNRRRLEGTRSSVRLSPFGTPSPGSERGDIFEIEIRMYA